MTQEVQDLDSGASPTGAGTTEAATGVQQRNESSSEPSADQRKEQNDKELREIAENEEAVEPYVKRKEELDAEEREIHDDEAVDAQEDADAEANPHKRKSRSQRLREQRDRAMQENTQLRAMQNPETWTMAEKVGRARAQMEAAAHVVPDFNEVIESGGPIRDHVASAVVDSPIFPRVLYELKKDQELLEYVNNASPHDAARLIGRMEAALGEGLTIRGKPRSQTTKAPPPIRPLSGGGAAPAKSLKDLADSDDITGYARERDRQSRARR